ncbi:alpha/beta-hydrolase [Amylostereum chailletii]|nr:alpha/beta-hydrolase [Amylostereum chailletii]
MSPPHVCKLLTSTDGTSIYADAIGDPCLPCLVFVHGLALSSIVFNDIFDNPRYYEHFYLVRYDMRGHGRSGKPAIIEMHSSQKYAEDYSVVVQAFGIVKPVFVGWSMGATIVADIAQHLPPDTLSGVVHLAGLPYIGPIMSIVGKPVILDFLPGLFTTTDSVTSAKTKIAFVDSLFADPAAVPYETKCAWIGSALTQMPAVSQCVCTRPQDPDALFDVAKKGLPLLLLCGSEDSQIDAEKVVDEMKARFSDVTVRVFEGLGHALFYEDQAAVMESIVAFARRVRQTVD